VRGVRIQVPNRLVGGQRSRRPRLSVYSPALSILQRLPHLFHGQLYCIESCFPRASLSDPVQTDQGDEALNRWKASLGLGSGTAIADPNDPRKCIIKSLALVWLPFRRSSS
jgi:hypothetical protein